LGVWRGGEGMALGGGKHVEKMEKSFKKFKIAVF